MSSIFIGSDFLTPNDQFERKLISDFSLHCPYPFFPFFWDLLVFGVSWDRGLDLGLNKKEGRTYVLGIRSLSCFILSILCFTSNCCLIEGQHPKNCRSRSQSPDRRGNIYKEPLSYNIHCVSCLEEKSFCKMLSKSNVIK